MRYLQHPTSISGLNPGGPSSNNASNTVREGPVVAGVQVGVDERAGDAVEGGGVVGIFEVLGERPLPRLTGGANSTALTISANS